MLKRYRYRAYPTAPQGVEMGRLFGCCRVVYNDAIHAREAARAEGRKVTMGELSRALTLAKTTPEREWLTQVSSVPLQQALADANKAYSNFFTSLKGKRKGSRMGSPRFKKRSNKQSARFTRNARFKVHEAAGRYSSITLPGITGRVSYVSSRPLPSDPSSVTLIREPDGRYYLSFVVDEAPKSASAPTAEAAGVDPGLTTLATVARSNGGRYKVENPRFLRRKERALARAQRSLSRKAKGSKNQEKARIKVAVLHRKVRETRLDHHHKFALELVRENQVIAFEGSNIRALARTRMAKSMHDASWGTLKRLVVEKATEYGRTVHTPSQWAPTSQVCSVCGVRDGKKSFSVREWTCSACGSVLDRDWNAAVNIMLAAGLAESLNAHGGNIRRTLACAVPSEVRTTPPVPAHAA